MSDIRPHSLVAEDLFRRDCQMMGYAEGRLGVTRMLDWTSLKAGPGVWLVVVTWEVDEPSAIGDGRVVSTRYTGCYVDSAGAVIHPSSNGFGSGIVSTARGAA